MRERENCELIFLKHKQCKQVIGEKVEKIVHEVSMNAITECATTMTIYDKLFVTY